jgi:hypothetical protein
MLCLLSGGTDTSGNYGLPAAQTIPTLRSMNERKNLILPTPHEELPLPGEKVMVITRKFRCRGYIDAKGVWHHDTDGAPIEDVVGWDHFNWWLPSTAIPNLALEQKRGCSE